MDWLAKMLQLPKEFLFSENGKGGGVIQVGLCSSLLIDSPKGAELFRKVYAVLF